MSGAPPRFAIYDLDRTITRLPTWSRFLLFAARRRGRWRLALIPLLAVPALLRLAGLVDRRTLKEAMHRLMIGRATASADLAMLAGAFADGEIATNIRAEARAAIAADVAAGRRVVIATAANLFYAHEIASRLGIHEVIATRNAVDVVGNVLCGIAGDNCYGEAKARAIAAWIAAAAPDRDDASIRFYSDHISDLPAFSEADEPIVVNPAVRLRRTAEARGWRIVDWS